jgi:hypothetical protein
MGVAEEIITFEASFAYASMASEVIISSAFLHIHK